MSNTIQSAQAVNAYSQVAPTAQPSKAPANTQSAPPQDKVTISAAAQQALAKAGASHDVDHDGDSH